MKHYLINTFLLVFPTIALAQFNDAKMYQAYLKQNMDVWQQALDEAYTISKPTVRQLEKIVNYEYGYIPARLDEKNKEEAKRVMEKMTEHVDLLEKYGSDAAMILIYRSSLYAYAYKLNVWDLSSVSKCIECVEKAYEMSPNNPMVISLKGNIDFYRPGIFGGSKKRALFCFEKSLKLFEEQNLTTNNWNYIATYLAMAQAYEKNGEKEKAILTCKKILEVSPNFEYVKNVYYPKLTKK